MLRILSEHQEGLQARDVLRAMERQVPPTVFESTDYPNRPGVRRFEKIIRFTTINAVKAGWLTKKKGLWALTEAGMKALHRHQDPEELFREAKRLYKEWKAEQPEEEEIDDDTSVTTVATLEEAEEIAWSQVQEHLTRLGPYDFQELVSGLLIAMGYHVSWVAPPGPDGGTDIIAHLDALGIEGPRIKVQVKRQQNAMRVSEIRAFMATLG
ncbi:MAG: restriction endonuclease, partial [Gemmatimonadota bacterium]